MDAKNEMIRKGGTLLDACEVITVASVDGKGYPRPVPVVKLAAEGCGQIWFATGAGSRKTAQFRANLKAGVSFFAGHDSVVLTGFIEEVPDPARRAFWQDWMLEHFPLVADDPEYCLLKFTAQCGTFWIGGEFVTYDL